MPTYRLERDGQTFDITAPNEAAALKAFQQSSYSDRGAGNAFLTGARETMKDIGAGFAPGAADPRHLAAAGTTQEEYQRAMQSHAMTPAPGLIEAQEHHPLVTGLGQATPYLAGSYGTSMAMSPAPLASRMGAQALTGGAIGASRYGDPVDRLVQGGTDAALAAGGELVGDIGTRLIAPGMRPRTGDVQADIAAAQQLGYRPLPTTGTDTGIANYPRQVFEGGLASTPGGSVVMAQVSAQNQALLNKAAAEAIGEVTEEAPTSRVLAAARARLGETFEAAATRGRPVPVIPDDLARVDMLEDEAIAPFLRGEADPVGATLERLREHLSNPEIDAQTLMKLQSRIGKQGRQALRGENSNPDLGHALLDIQDMLLDMLRRDLPLEEQAAFDTARQQYRNLMTLESGSNIDPVTGDVYPGRMAAYLQRRDRAGFLEGGNTSPLYQGVRFLGRIQPELKSSGTAERSMIGRVLTGGGVGGGLGYAGGGGDPEAVMTGAAIGIGSGIVPYALAKGYTSPTMAQWATRQLPERWARTGRLPGHAVVRHGTEPDRTQDTSIFPADNKKDPRELIYLED